MNHWPQEEKVDTFAFSSCNRRYQNLLEIPGSEISSFVLAHLNVKKTATVSSWIPLVMFVFVLEALKAPWQNVWVLPMTFTNSSWWAWEELPVVLCSPSIFFRQAKPSYQQDRRIIKFVWSGKGRTPSNCLRDCASRDKFPHYEGTC